MQRIRILAVFALLAAMAVGGVALAGNSPRNPYKGLNLSGINYGASQWERQHRNSSSHSYRSRGFRR